MDMTLRQKPIVKIIVAITKNKYDFLLYLQHPMIDVCVWLSVFVLMSVI